MLGYLVEDLCHKGKRQEAKGIMTRNNVETHVRQDIVAELRALNYSEELDTSLQKHDVFGPLSQPVKDYCVLPDFVKVHFIATDNDVSKLEILLNEPFIGVDSEWRPQLTQLHKTKPSLF